MPKIIIYTDLTAQVRQNIYALDLCRGLQAESEVRGNFIPERYNALYFPLWYFDYSNIDYNFPKRPKWLSHFQNEILSGNDIVVAAPFLPCYRHQHVVNFLKQFDTSKNYEIQAVLNIARMDLFYERAQRTSKEPFTEVGHANSIASVENFYDTIELYDREFGRNNVKILFDNSSSIGQVKTNFSELIKALGLPEYCNNNLPSHILDFTSVQGRQIWRLFTDDCYFNFWFNDIFPSLEQAIKQCELKGDWDIGFVVPYEQRLDIHQAAVPCYKKLEERLGSEFQFDYNNTHIEQNYELNPLTLQNCKDVISLLDKETIKKLTVVFTQYKRLLDKEQNLLLSALEKSMVNDSSFIENIKELPKLSVLTLCYNHEKYISECIESVQAQRTTFPMKHIIVDHCSDDKSQEIILKYAKKYDNIVPYFLNSRIGDGVNVKTLFTLADTEFVSLCDGDDYFTDLFKLQKQVDLLEENPTYGMCFHPVNVKYENASERNYIYPSSSVLPRGVRPFYYLAELFRKNIIQTNSAVYRWRFKDELPNWFRSDLLPGDWYWHLLHAEKGKVGFIPEVMSVYRRHTESLYSINEYDGFHKHFLTYGMTELETFDVINSHFEGRYENVIMPPVEQVFKAFLWQQLEKDDDSYLNQAIEKYPNFAKKFLESLKK